MKQTDDQHKGFEQVVEECHELIDKAGRAAGSEFHGNLVKRLRFILEHDESMINTLKEKLVSTKRRVESQRREIQDLKDELEDQGRYLSGQI